ncbi:CPBP family intramembrane metalloprotease [Erwinia sp. CPCC 100877]|nr:CPBP family intramembrane metalloprotease [Erwinia sp. CPCC 100877]
MNKQLFKIVYILIYLFIKRYLPAVGVSWDFSAVHIVFCQNLFLGILGFFFFKQSLLRGLKKLKPRNAVIFILGVTIGMFLIDYLYAALLFKSIIFQSYSYGFLEIFQAVLMIPFIEELVYRYCFINPESKSYVQWLCLFLSSVIFSNGHLASVNYNLISLIPVFVSSLFLSFVYLYKENIWYNIFAHSLYNCFVLLLPLLT